MARQSLIYQLKNFWYWWSGEITALMPERVRALLRGGKPAQLLYKDETLRIVNQGMSGAEVAENYLRIIDFNDAEHRRVVNSASAIRLCLEPKKYLFKKVSLPLETEENLREVLAFEMDRQTPFNADQVYYDYVINARDKQNRTLDITLILAPIDKISLALKQLEENNVRINAISPCEEINPDLNEVNLLPPEKREKPRKRYRLVNLMLFLIMLPLLVGNMILPVWQKSVLAKQLEIELDDYRSKAKQVAALRELVTKAKQENSYLEEKKLNSVSVLEILLELTLLIPNDTWVSNFEVRDNSLHLHGQSTSSASLIPILETSKLFQNVTFRSPVTRSKKSNTERFHISAELVSNKEGKG
ncbi:MAG: PilN domain-containing protein [Candidatus Thiodiazotropha sp. (ex Ctena orbiculata)]|nr:PilN domain-containing protein [Candidatus Thiodiazotropha taylori]MBT2998139.1 PilN domain-containing protein [Candidatus Thiodiazotropha taylori]MBT3002438.1 PilN domain-containing protein [Candidatus Thiodiazotropha taylori]MBT3026698.1 PilN domain-containing protein [Candidatus Thiodiazotropha taylori]MBT3034180.1 PilN domain-containing protein [Candidatus Thiodiazotropha taylori]